MITLGDMVVKIVGDTSGLSNSLTDSQKKMMAFSVNVAAITAAIVQMGKQLAKATKEYADYGSVIDDASKRTGLSTDAIQEWKYIAEQAGTTLEAVTGSVGMMTRGLETNKQAFADLGIETKNADGSFKSTTEIFNDTVLTLSRMKDETARDAAAFKLLGRSAQSLIPILKDGEAGINAMREEARGLGIIIDKETITKADALGDAMLALNTSMKAAKVVIINDFAPAIMDLALQFKAIIDKTVSYRQELDAYRAAVGGSKMTQEQLTTAIRGTAAETARLQGLVASLEPGYEAQRTELEIQIVASKALEQSLRAQAIAMASASEANKLGTQAAKDKAASDAKAAAAAKISADAATAAAEKRKKELQELSDAELAANLEWVNIQQQNTDVANWSANYLIAKEKEKTDALILEAQRYAESYIPLMNNVRDVTRSIFSQLGTDMATQELSWKSLGTAAINSIGAIVSAMGDQLAAKAAARLVEAFADLASIKYALLAPGEFASAGLLAGGAAAAWTAGAALSAVKLATGGLASSPTLAMIGDNSRYPEVVAPLSPDVFAGIANGILGALASRSRPAGVNESNAMAARSSSINNSSAVNLNVGTLIADDAGMRTLERTLRRFGLQEDVRVGA